MNRCFSQARHAPVRPRSVRHLSSIAVSTGHSAQASNQVRSVRRRKFQSMLRVPSHARRPRRRVPIPLRPRSLQRSARFPVNSGPYHAKQSVPPTALLRDPHGQLAASNSRSQDDQQLVFSDSSRTQFVRIVPANKGTASQHANSPGTVRRHPRPTHFHRVVNIRRRVPLGVVLRQNSTVVRIRMFPLVPDKKPCLGQRKPSPSYPNSFSHSVNQHVVYRGSPISFFRHIALHRRTFRDFDSVNLTLMN